MTIRPGGFRLMRPDQILRRISETPPANSTATMPGSWFNPSGNRGSTLVARRPGRRHASSEILQKRGHLGTWSLFSGPQRDWVGVGKGVAWHVLAVFRSF